MYIKTCVIVFVCMFLVLFLFTSYSSMFPNLERVQTKSSHVLEIQNGSNSPKDACKEEIKYQFSSVVRKVGFDDLKAKFEYGSSGVKKPGDRVPTWTQECTKKVPNVIVQYGEARSGSTLQFHTLCLMMLMLHEEEAKSVGCSFGAIPASKFKVIKTHNINSLLKQLPLNTWIFMTLKVKNEPQKLERENIEKMKKRNLTIQNTVDLDEVGRTGFYIATKYQELFGLSEEKMLHVLEYLRYWDILRQCCGKQMSSDWRNKLAPKEGYKQHNEPHSLTYPACEMYNITQVETLFINTYIYQKFIRTKSLRNCIGVLDGHYCERCNRNITEKELHKLNDKCA